MNGICKIVWTHLVWVCSVAILLGLISCDSDQQKKDSTLSRESFSGYWSDFRGAFSPPQNPANYTFDLRGDTLLGNTVDKQISIQAILQEDGTFRGKIKHRGGQNNVIIYPEPEYDFRMMVKLLYNNNRHLEIWLMKQE